MPRRHRERIEPPVLLVLEPNLGGRNPWDGVRYLQALQRLAETSAGVRPGHCCPLQRTGSLREAESARHNTELFVHGKHLGPASCWALPLHPKPDTLRPPKPKLTPNPSPSCVLVPKLVCTGNRCRCEARTPGNNQGAIVKDQGISLQDPTKPLRPAVMEHRLHRAPEKCSASRMLRAVRRTTALAMPARPVLDSPKMDPRPEEPCWTLRLRRLHTAALAVFVFGVATAMVLPSAEKAAVPAATASPSVSTKRLKLPCEAPGSVEAVLDAGGLQAAFVLAVAAVTLALAFGGKPRHK